MGTTLGLETQGLQEKELTVIICRQRGCTWLRQAQTPSTHQGLQQQVGWEAIRGALLAVCMHGFCICADWLGTACLQPLAWCRWVEPSTPVAGCLEAQPSCGVRGCDCASINMALFQRPLFTLSLPLGPKMHIIIRGKMGHLCPCMDSHTVTSLPCRQTA